MVRARVRRPGEREVVLPAPTHGLPGGTHVEDGERPGFIRGVHSDKEQRHYAIPDLATFTQRHHQTLSCLQVRPGPTRLQKRASQLQEPEGFGGLPQTEQRYPGVPAEEEPA